MSRTVAPRAKPSATARTTSRRSKVELDAVSPSGLDEATEQALDLGSARRRPELRAEQEVARRRGRDYPPPDRAGRYPG